MEPSITFDPLALHQRLLAKDPTASSDVFLAFYEDLAGWLKCRHPYLAPGIDEDIYREAAFRAINDYIQAPHKYDPLATRAEGLPADGGRRRPQEHAPAGAAPPQPLGAH